MGFALNVSSHPTRNEHLRTTPTSRGQPLSTACAEFIGLVDATCYELPTPCHLLDLIDSRQLTTRIHLARSVFISNPNHPVKLNVYRST